MKFWISRLESQQDSTVSKPQERHLRGYGYSSEWELLQGARRGPSHGHHLSGTACALCTGTADGSDGSLLPGLWSHSLAAPGPRVALPLPIVPAWGQAGGQCSAAVAQSVTRFTRDGCRGCACKCSSRPGPGAAPIFAEAGRGCRADSSRPPPSEHRHLAAQQDGGGNCTAPGSEQRSASGSPSSQEMAAFSGLLSVSEQSFPASGIALLFYWCVNTLSEK